MSKLFDVVRTLQQDVVRNIVKPLSAKEAFADLSEHPTEDSNIAEAAVDRVLNQSVLTDDWHFHYTAAIGYPFETDYFMASRYSDGSYPVWYGSIDKMTTLHETAYYMMKKEIAIEGIQDVEVITRERVIYDVYCQGMLIDLTQKKEIFPWLVTDDYKQTQEMAKLLYDQGYPGLLSPSARYTNGININLFKNDLLSNPRVNCELIYRYYPKLKKVEIYHSERSAGLPWLTIAAG